MATRVAPTCWLSRPGIGERYACIKRNQHRRETGQEKPERDRRKTFDQHHSPSHYLRPCRLAADGDVGQAAPAEKSPARGCLPRLKSSYHQASLEGNAQAKCVTALRHSRPFIAAPRPICAGLSEVNPLREFRGDATVRPPPKKCAGVTIGGTRQTMWTKFCVARSRPTFRSSSRLSSSWSLTSKPQKRSVPRTLLPAADEVIE
jgi:hypothetical protein